MAGINSGAQYLTSVPGVLKILEIILLLVSIGCVGYFFDNYFAKDLDDYPKNDNLKYFIGATGIAAGITLLCFVLFLIGLQQIIRVFVNIAGFISVLLAILVLVGSGFLADALKYYHDKNHCDVWEILELKSQCKQLTAGVVCGFSAGILFIVDGIVQFKS